MATSFEMKKNDYKASERESHPLTHEVSVVLPGFLEKTPTEATLFEGTLEEGKESETDASLKEKERERERGEDESGHTSPVEGASHRCSSSAPYWQFLLRSH